MLKVVIVKICGICVIRRVNVDALYLPCVLRLQRFEGEQIVPVDEHVSHLWGV